LHEAGEEWTERVAGCRRVDLVNEVPLWITGVNTSVEDKTVRGLMGKYKGRPTFVTDGKLAD
jgi:hypothetical protein